MAELIGEVQNLRYDKIRYDSVYLRALKSWQKGQLQSSAQQQTPK